MTTSIARSVSVRQKSRISWRTRQNARYRNGGGLAGCSPHQALEVKVQPTAHGRHRSDTLLPSVLEQRTALPLATPAPKPGPIRPYYTHPTAPLRVCGPFRPNVYNFYRVHTPLPDA